MGMPVNFLLHCYDPCAVGMASVLDLSSESALSRLTNYERYYLLDDDDETALLALCIALSPDELTGS